MSNIRSDATRRTRLLLALVAPSLFACGAITAGATEPADSKPAKPKPTTSSLDDELFKDLADDPAPASKKPSPIKQPESTAQPKPTAKPDPAPKADPTKKPLNPLDQELLNDLGGAPDAKPAQKPNDEAHGKPAGRPTGGGGDGGASEPESDDPLVRLTRRVRDAEQRLRRTDSGEQTQELQRGIVEDLEKLIAQIEQQKSQQQSSSSKSKSPPSGAKPGQKKPGPLKQGSTPGDKPASNPTDSSEQLTAKKTEKADAGKLKDMLEKVWGRLPERERQDVMQSSFEDFPAKYQYSIEQYFKTLLQRKD